METRAQSKAQEVEMEESRLAELESRLTRRFSAEIERIRATSSQRSSGTIKPIRLSPLKYSWEEVNERREKGLCIFCDENETPDHHLKHKGLGLVFMDVDDQSFDEEVVELSSALLTPKGDDTSSVEKKTEMVVTDKKETMEVKDVTDSAMNEPHDVIAEGGREKKPAEKELENSVHSSLAIHSFVVESIHEQESIKADSTQTEELSETDDNSSPLWHRWKTKSRDAVELDENSGSIGNQAQSHGDKLPRLSPPLWLPGSNISLTHLPRQLSQHRLQQQQKKKSCKTFMFKYKLNKTVLVQALQTLQLKDRYDMRVPEAKLKFSGIEEDPLLANVTSYRFSLYTTNYFAVWHRWIIKELQGWCLQWLSLTQPRRTTWVYNWLSGLISSSSTTASLMRSLEKEFKGDRVQSLLLWFLLDTSTLILFSSWIMFETSALVMTAGFTVFFHQQDKRPQLPWEPGGFHSLEFPVQPEVPMVVFVPWDPGDFLLIHLKLRGIVSSTPYGQSQFVRLEEDAVRVVKELQVEDTGVEHVFGNLVPLQETAGQGWDETLFREDKWKLRRLKKLSKTWWFKFKQRLWRHKEYPTCLSFVRRRTVQGRFKHNKLIKDWKFKFKRKSKMQSLT